MNGYIITIGNTGMYISYTNGEHYWWNWDIDRAELFDCISDAKNAARMAKIPHPRVIAVHRQTAIGHKE